MGDDVKGVAGLLGVLLIIVCSLYAIWVHPITMLLHVLVMLPVTIAAGTIGMATNRGCEFSVWVGLLGGSLWHFMLFLGSLPSGWSGVLCTLAVTFSVSYVIELIQNDNAHTRCESAIKVELVRGRYRRRRLRYKKR